MLDPHPGRLDGIKYNRFYLGRYIAHIKTDKRPWPEPWRTFNLKPRQSLSVIARDLTRSKELEIMRTVLAASKRPER